LNLFFDVIEPLIVRSILSTRVARSARKRDDDCYPDRRLELNDRSSHGFSPIALEW
jgi:hypothetical protein